MNQRSHAIPYLREVARVSRGRSHKLQAKKFLVKRSAETKNSPPLPPLPETLREDLETQTQLKSEGKREPTKEELPEDKTDFKGERTTQLVKMGFLRPRLRNP